MTRLEELRRLLDEHELEGAITESDLDALLDVAEAVDAGLGEIGDCDESWECADGCCLNIVPRHGDLYNTLGIALAPLVEATDD